jgi:hypothetical protein
MLNKHISGGGSPSHIIHAWYRHQGLGYSPLVVPLVMQLLLLLLLLQVLFRDLGEKESPLMGLELSLGGKQKG